MQYKKCKMIEYPDCDEKDLRLKNQATIRKIMKVTRGCAEKIESQLDSEVEIKVSAKNPRSEMLLWLIKNLS